MYGDTNKRMSFLDDELLKQMDEINFKNIIEQKEKEHIYGKEKK